MTRLFLLDNYPDFIRQLHQAVKINIAKEPKSAEAYAEIYWRIWSQSKGIHRLEIEEHCIQSFLEVASIGAKEHVVEAARIVLDPFFKNKKTKGVDELLYRLTLPFIWKNLHVPHPTVRKNTLHLLIQAFPLQDPEGTKEAGEVYLSKQMKIFEEVFYDESPEVRILATTGACRILSLYWELIPEHEMRKVVARLINDCAHDKSYILSLTPVFLVAIISNDPSF